jgi:methionine aminotransferase
MSAPVLQSKLPKVGTTVFSVMSALAVKHEAINLGQGFPDFDCDPRLVEAVADAMRSGHNQYPLMPGVPLLRERVAAKVEAMHGVRYDPASEITITAGATQGILSCILAVARPGDEVIVLEPCYDSYIPNIELAGARAVPIPLRRGTFDPDFDAIAAAVGPATRAIIVNTPHNPSGRTWSAADWQRLSDIIGHRDIWVISDEVYEHMVFDGVPHISAARHPLLRERTFVVSSFGKTFHVTGWKIGTVCAPAPLTSEFRKVHQYTVFTANSPMQHGIAAYLSDPRPYVELPAFYQAKRDSFAAGLAQTPLRALACEGSYFQCASYADISELRDFSERDCCEWMTREIGVTPIPVSAFYSTPTEQQVIRFCFAKRDSTLDAALARLLRLAPPR